MKIWGIAIVLVLALIAVGSSRAEELDPPVLQGFSCYKAIVVTANHDEWRGRVGYITIASNNGTLVAVRLSPQLDGKTWIGNYVCPDSRYAEYTAMEGYIIDRKKIPILGMPSTCQYWKHVFLPVMVR